MCIWIILSSVCEGLSDSKKPHDISVSTSVRHFVNLSDIICSICLGSKQSHAYQCSCSWATYYILSTKWSCFVTCATIMFVCVCVCVCVQSHLDYVGYVHYSYIFAFWPLSTYCQEVASPLSLSLSPSAIIPLKSPIVSLRDIHWEKNQWTCTSR